MLLQVIYQAPFFVRMMGGNFVDRIGDVGWKSFPPNINLLFHELKTHLFVRRECCGSVTHLFVDFPQYLLALKIRILFTSHQRQGQIPRLKLIAMLDSGWNSTQHHGLGDDCLLSRYLCPSAWKRSWSSLMIQFMWHETNVLDWQLGVLPQSVASPR